MKHVSVAIIGAGQCGLAMSHALAQRRVDHVVIERGQIGNSWRTERWASLKLLTPNWMNGLAGLPYSGPEPGGFMSVGDLVERFDQYAAIYAPPVMSQTEVLSVDRYASRYLVKTSRGAIIARMVVVATGQCGQPKLPGFAADVPAEIAQIAARDYKRPEDLPPGGVLVVGASASGLQLARELRLSGRPVTLAVGNHLRLPRRYRGADILTWAHRAQIFDLDDEAGDDMARLRRLPSLPLIGSDDPVDLDLNLLQGLGVEITGRMAGIAGTTAQFSGNLANLCASADLKLNRLLDRFDAWATQNGLDAQTPAPTRPEPTRVPETPRLGLDLADGSVRTILWATGYRPDHDWLNLPVFDARGQIRHEGGVVGQGLYVLGLPYLRSGRSTHIDGAAEDAEALARHMMKRLGRRRAA